MDTPQQPLTTDKSNERAFTAALADFAVNLAAISNLNRWCDFVVEQATALVGADEGQVYLDTRPLSTGDTPLQLTVPLRTRGETLGILTVTRRHSMATEGAVIGQETQPLGFSSDDRRRLSLLSNVAAVALAGIKRTQATRRQADWRDRALNLVQEIGQVMSSTLELAPLMRRITNAAVRALQAEAGMLALLDDNGNLILRAAAGSISHDLIDTPLESKQSIIGWVTRHGRAALVPDPSADPRASLDHPVARAGLGPRTLLAAPLVTKGHTIGAIEVANKSFGTFDQGDQRLLEALALSAAAAIENARLYEHIRRQALQQENMIRVGHAMSSAQDVDTVLQEIVESALAVIPAAFTAAVHLMDEKEKVLRLHCYAGRPLWDTMKEPFLIKQGIAGHVFATRQVANVSDVLAEPRYISGPGRIVYRSLLVAPLIVEDQPLGTLSVNGLEPQAFSRDDEQMIRGLAVQSTAVLRNARLLDSLRESEIRYRGLVENVNALLLITNASGHIVFAGGRWAEMMGYKPEEVVGRSYQSLVHPQDWPELAQQVAKLRSGPSRVSDLRHRVLRRDGTVCWLQGSAVSASGESDRVERVYAVVHDVSARVEAEQAIARHADQLAALNTIASSISRSLDLDKIVRDGLQKLMTLLDVDAAGLNLLDVNRNHFTPHTTIGLSSELSGLVVPLQDSKHIHPLRTQQPALIPDLRAYPLVAHSPNLPEMLQREGMRTLASVPVIAQDEVIGVLFVAARAPNAISSSALDLLATVGQQFGIALHNAHLYTQAEDRAVHLEAAYRHLQNLARRKSQFIQNTSHELRMPLTFVRSYVELLLSNELGTLPDQQRQILNIIDQKNRRLVGLVNDIASLMDIDFGPDDIEPVNLVDVLTDRIATHQERARQASIVLQAQWPDILPIVKGSPHRLAQAFDHLLDNAIKFSPDGGQVSIQIQIKGRNAFIQIADQGIGIPPDQHELIFDRFYQVDGSTTRRFGGTGLGLALVKETIEAHGGMVRVKSDGLPGQGSIFTLIIPLLKSP
jgi:PAS domain S-box-containing protein